MYKLLVLLLCTTPTWVWSAPNSYRSAIRELLAGVTDSHSKVAVAAMAYSDGRDATDGGVVVERLTTELARAGTVTVIERAQIEKVFAELKLQRSGAISEDSIHSIGTMLGADAVIVGTLTDLSSKQVELNLRLIDVESSRVVNATSTVVQRDWIPQEIVNIVISQVPVPVQATTPKHPGTTKPIWLGDGCGCDLYYEGDGSFMRWAKGLPHGQGGQGAYVKHEDNQYCNFVAHIERIIQYRHPELTNVWAAYRKANRI